MSKKMSLPVTFEMTEDNPLNDDTLVFSRIKVCHDGLNLNNSTFSTEAFEDAKESIKNRPLLAYVRKVDGTDQKDFVGHEIELSVGEDGIKVIYLERPIGVIPESNNYEMEVDEDGKTWVYVDAIIWADYANDAMDIFEENPNKPVSMEIVVDEYEEKDGAFDITKYRYTGVTVLGDDVSPAMAGANIQVQFSEDEDSIVEMIKERTEDINARLSAIYSKEEPTSIEQESQEENFEHESVKEEPEAEATNDEFEAEPEGVQNPEVQEVFELTYQDKYELLNKAVRKSVEEDKWAWVRDFTDEWVIYEVESREDDEWMYSNYRVGYSVEGEEVMLGENRVEVFVTWATQEELDMLDSQRAEMELKLSELQEKFNKVEEELTAYQTAERKEMEDALYDEFDKALENSDEYQDLKSKASEYSIDELEDRIRILHSKTMKPKFNKKKSTNFASLKVVDDKKKQETTVENPYEGVNFKKG